MNAFSPSSPLTPSNPGPPAAGGTTGRESNFLAAAAYSMPAPEVLANTNTVTGNSSKPPVSDIVTFERDKKTRSEELFSTLKAKAKLFLNLIGIGTMLGGSTLKSPAAVVPDGADLSGYRQVGNTMPARVWIKVERDGQVYHTSGTELGDGWYLTAAHNVTGPWGSATITRVGNGTHPTNDPGETRVVIEQHVYEGFVHSLVGGGNYTCDLCAFRTATPLSDYHAKLRQSRLTVSSNTTSGGYGMLAYPPTGYVIPYDHTLTGWHAEVASTVPLNVSSTYNFALRTTTSLPNGKNGKASNNNSGCPVLDMENSIAGIVISGSGGTTLAGQTVVLDITHPEAKAFIARYYKPPDPQISLSNFGPNMIKISWNQFSTGYRVQMNTSLEPNDWVYISPVIQDTGSINFDTSNYNRCFFRLFKSN